MKGGGVAGVAGINKNIRKIARNQKISAVAAMKQVAIEVQRESMLRAPIDTGNLRGSHRTKIFARGAKIWAAIYLTAAYALFVHEASPDTQFQSPAPRGRKFLERGMRAAMPTIRRITKRWLLVPRNARGI